MPRISRNQSQTHTEDNGEDFDLNVAGSDSENDVASSAPAPVLHRAVTQVVNDLEPRSRSSTAAHDIWHYFKKVGNDDVQILQCRVCKYVVPFQLSIFLTSDACTGRIEMPTSRAGMGE